MNLRAAWAFGFVAWSALGATQDSQPTSRPAARALEPQELFHAGEYRIWLKPDMAKKTVDLAVDIDLRARVETNEILLHFTGPEPHFVVIDGSSAKWRQEGELLHIACSPRQAGDAVLVHIAYSGKPRSGIGFADVDVPMTRNAETNNEAPVLFTDTAPRNARAWLPCIDHPSDRAITRIQVDVAGLAGNPRDHVVVATGVRYRAAPDEPRVWIAKEPIPAALITIAVGPYVRIKLPPNAKTDLGLKSPPPSSLTVWAFDNVAGSARFALWGVHPLVSYLGELAGRPAPFGQLNFVTFPYEARWGFQPRGDLLPIPANYVDGLSELVPQLPSALPIEWFGNLIGIAYERDRWLSIGFAEYCQRRYHTSAIYVDYATRRWGDRARLNEEVSSHAADRSRFAATQDALELPSAIPKRSNYYWLEKRAWVFFALGQFIGVDRFDKSIPKFIDRCAGRAITYDEFSDVISEVTGIDVHHFLDVWSGQKGFPTFRVVKPAGVAGNRATWTIEQTQSGPVFPCALDVVEVGGDKPQRHALRFEKDRTATFETTNLAATDVTLDPDAWLLHERKD